MTEQPDYDVEAAIEEELADLGTGLMDDGPVNMTAMLVRKMAWDTTQCTKVPDLLTALGLTHGTPEGMQLDHDQSHTRLYRVLPLEQLLAGYSSVLGGVLTKSMLMAKGADISDEDEEGFAEQNAEIVMAAARAIVANLLDTGILAPGPTAMQIPVVVFREADGDV